MVTPTENELPPEPPVGTQNKSKIVYTRDFLLSLSSLDICKEFPVGIDASILQELEDSSTTSFDRQRSIGVSPLHGSKHSEYGSLSSNRLEGSTSIPRGNAGRWDTRSSGSSDKDGDLQSDRDPLTQDPGRRFRNQTRRPWQHSEHDGLLGSGAFPRPSGPGYAGTQAPKARGNGNYQLSRSTEPYQPPRPYKAGPYSRKENTYSINDETFGSAEVSSDDRAEEERKRRASFELMRKEQHKALKEKQKVTNNGKENVGADIFTVLGNSGYEKRITDESNQIDDSVLLQSDSSRASFHIQPTASRPLVPPGFASAVSEKNICMQSSGTSLSSEGESALRENDQTRKFINNDQDGRDYSVSSMYVILQDDEVKSSSVQSEDALGSLISVSAVEYPKHSVGPEKLPSRTFGLQGYNEIWEGDAVNDLPNEKEARSEMADDHNHSTSILEKLFGNALSSSSNFVENQDVKAEDETESTALFESSKFAHWFVEEEKKPIEDLSSGGLLSLITNNENTGSHTVVSSEKSSKINYLTLPSKNKDTGLGFLPSPVASVVAGRNDQYDASDKPDSGSGILTCEDLEQSILAEVKDSSSSLLHSMEGFWLDDKLEEPKADVNDHASKHLLSLLHKGTNLKEFPSMIGVGVSPDKLADFDTSGNDSLKFEDNSIIRNSETGHSSQKNVTLEALFGAAFMTELHSAEAPLSVKRGSTSEIINDDVMQPHSLPLAHANPSFFFSTSNEYQMNRSNYEENLAASNNTGEAKAHVTPGSCLRYRDSPNRGSEIGNVMFEVGATEIQLPEEDSLITVGDSLNPRNPGSSSLRNANKEELIPEKTVEILSDKLLNAFLRDGEHLNSNYLDSRPIVHGSFDSVDSNNIYNQLHGRLYPPHILPHQINQTRPLFPQLDHLTYHNSQMKLRPQDINNDPHYPFPAGVIPQQSFDIATGSRFDPTAHHPSLPNMLFPTNFPLHHPIQGVPGVPSHPVNHMPGYTSQMNNVHNFPLHNQRQHFDGFRIGMPGVGGGGGGGTHPGVLERLIEMEMRANSRQAHPATAGHIHRTYGSELNANLRYR